MRAPELIVYNEVKTAQRFSPPDREWLEYHYVELDMSAREIGNIAGTSDVTVLTWLHAVGLARTHVEAMTKQRGRRSESRTAYNYEARGILQQAGRPELCAWCGQLGRVEVHHVDHDWHDQSLENLMWLCVPCHRLEGRLWSNRKRGKLEFHKKGNEIRIVILQEDRS